MLFSHKSSSHFDLFPSLSVSKTSIEQVTFFRYLGVNLSSNLSWSRHISKICSNSRKIIGLLFRHFYPYASSSTLIRLYTSLVRPILEYCSIIWDPLSAALCLSLESVQQFALKLSSKFRSSLINYLQSSFKVSSLASRRKCSKLIFIFKLYNNLIFFPSSVLQLSPPSCYPIRSYPPQILFLIILKKPLSRILSSHLQFFSGILSSLPSKKLTLFPIFLFFSINLINFLDLLILILKTDYIPNI